MIELIRAFTGYPRAEGRVKITEVGLYRCKVCETIKPSKQEILAHECTRKRKHIPNSKGSAASSN